MNSNGVIAALVAGIVLTAGFAAYSYSQYSYERGVEGGLSTQVQTLSSASVTLATQLSQANANLSSLTGQRDSLQAQLQLAQANATMLRGEISSLNDSFVAQRVSLQTQLESAQANATALQSQIASLNSSFMAQINSLQTQLESAQANTAQLQGQITSLNNQITQLQLQLSNQMVVLTNSTTFIVPAGSNASAATFPFQAFSTPRSWGDVGLVVTGTSQPVVAQTGYDDCIFVMTCPVTLSAPVEPGDMLLVFVSGYSTSSPGWQAQSVNDSLGSAFKEYTYVNWPASDNAYTDSVFYSTVTSGGASDSLMVLYNMLARHSDPIVMDVRGTSLSIFSSSSADCTVNCISTYSTPPAALPLNSSYLAAGNSYNDLGVGNNAGSGWTQVSSGVVFMTGEYSIKITQGCSLLPVLPSGFNATYSGYLSISGTTTSSNTTAIISFPGTGRPAETYTLGAYVSANIPIAPGGLSMQLENCGNTPLQATLTITEGVSPSSVPPVNFTR